MFIRRLTTTIAVVLGLVLLSVLAAPAAVAKDGDVRVRGVCTQSSSAKLKLSEEDGRIEVEFEVDQNRNGVRWHVTLRRNGAIVASRTAVTRGPSGSFEVRRVIADTAGADRVTAAATRAGERCSAKATWSSGR
jgi:hypothetical protein